MCYSKTMEQLGLFSIQPTSCVFTGHRDLDEAFSARALKKEVKKLLDKGITTFYNGFAIGFDMEAAKAVISFKKKYPTCKLVACIPCPEQEKYFTAEQKKLYYKLLKKADEKILVSDHYFNGCMLKRDRYMAERADVMLAYCKRKDGGTAYTVRYFQKVNPGSEIIFL